MSVVTGSGSNESLVAVHCVAAQAHPSRKLEGIEQDEKLHFHVPHYLREDPPAQVVFVLS